MAGTTGSSGPATPASTTGNATSPSGSVEAERGRARIMGVAGGLADNPDADNDDSENEEYIKARTKELKDKREKERKAANAPERKAPKKKAKARK